MLAAQAAAPQKGGASPTSYNQVSSRLIEDSVEKVVTMRFFRYRLNPIFSLSGSERSVCGAVQEEREKHSSAHWKAGKVYDIRGVDTVACKISLAQNKKLSVYLISDDLCLIVAERVSKGYKLLVIEQLSDMMFKYKDDSILFHKKVKVTTKLQIDFLTH